MARDENAHGNERGFERYSPPPPASEPQPSDWDYRQRSGAMAVVGLIAASSFLWAISGLLLWGMVAAFADASESTYNPITGRYQDNSGMVIPGIIALVLAILCWVGAVWVGVKAVYRVLEFHAEISAIEIVRRWRAADAANSQNAPGD